MIEHTFQFSIGIPILNRLHSSVTNILLFEVLQYTILTHIVVHQFNNIQTRNLNIVFGNADY